MTLTHSLRKRFAFKLVGNIAALALGMIALAVSSRALGPADFGRFEFLTNNFRLVLDTLALQLPVAYFNWISRKGHKENTDYATGLTFSWSLGIMAAFAMGIFATEYFGANDWLWPDVPVNYLWYALALTSVVFVFQLLTYLSDGLALTVGLEKIRLTQNLLKTAGILILFGWGALNLSTYFLIQTWVVVFSVAAAMVWLSTRAAYSARAFRFWSCSNAEKAEFREFAISYARPLMASMLVGFAYIYFDRWFLQFIAGSSAQGYYALSERLGTVIFIFTSAMTPLLSREFAYAHEAGDTTRLVRLFDRIKIFIFIAAAAACFMSVQSTAIVELFAGDKYRDAVVPVAIMAFFPIHQTFGQLSGALLISTGQTGLYAKLAILVMLASAPVSYFLLAPHDFLVAGLALGATGLAIKMVAVQFFGTNLQLYFNTKFLNISFARWLTLQFKVIGILYAISLASYFLSRQIPDNFLLALTTLGLAQHLYILAFHLILSGIFYAVLMAGLLFLMPDVAGINRLDLTGLLARRATGTDS